MGLSDVFKAVRTFFVDDVEEPKPEADGPLTKMSIGPEVRRIAFSSRFQPEELLFCAQFMMAMGAEEQASRMMLHLELRLKFPEKFKALELDIVEYKKFIDLLNDPKACMNFLRDGEAYDAYFNNPSASLPQPTP